MQKCVFFRSYGNINLTKPFIYCNFVRFIGKFEYMPDITYEIKFKTARSGGKGGQNVNKVETMVEGYWHVDSSAIFTPEQKERLQAKLVNKINADGFLLIKSQEDRSQLGNKLIVIEKMNDAVTKALIVPKKRKPTKPSKASKIKRLESKKKAGTIKQQRRKPSGNE
jgi:ribosome-associated protein